MKRKKTILIKDNLRDILEYNKSKYGMSASRQIEELITAYKKSGKNFLEYINK